jgi:hypothetical protein
LAGFTSGKLFLFRRCLSGVDEHGLCRKFLEAQIYASPADWPSSVHLPRWKRRTLPRG